MDTNGNSSENNAKDCPICMDPMSNRSLTDTCRHEFCFECLNQWSAQSNRCPVCRNGYHNIVHNIVSDDEFTETPVEEPHQHQDTDDDNEDEGYEEEEDAEEGSGYVFTSGTTITIQSNNQIYGQNQPIVEQYGQQMSEIGRKMTVIGQQMSQQINPQLRHQLGQQLGQLGRQMGEIGRQMGQQMTQLVQPVDSDSDDDSPPTRRPRHE